MKAKATHRGTCQLCGRAHKIDTKYGTVAKHGFTKEHGFFNGTCRGSDNKPLEVSCALLREYVEQHWPADAAQLREYAGRIRSGETAIKIEVYAGSPFGAKRVEELVRIEPGKYGGWNAVTKDYNGVATVCDRALGAYRQRTADEVWAKLRDRKAREIEFRAEQIEKHVERMRPLIENWQPRELTAI